VPLESLVQLLSRAIYATHNTLLPTIASIAGFIATVIAAQLLLGPIGLAAIPAAFAAGLAVEVAIMAVGLVPRMAQIGLRPPAARRIRPARRGGIWPPVIVRPRVGRAVAIAIGVVALGGAAVYATDLTLASGATIAVDPLVTPWARQNALIPANGPSASLPTVVAGSPGPLASPSIGASPAPGASAGGPPSAKPSPTPGPFAMDLYQKGDYVGELKDIWCVPAAMQTSMNIMNTAADVSQSTQARIFALARSIAPAPDGAAEPEAWATGLRELGYGNYQVTEKGSIADAIHLAARQIRLTNRPAGLMVWRGAHSWVMSGFAATADPATSSDFTVTAVRIEDVWYPRLSSIWGYSRPPDSLVPVSALPRDYLPWKRPTGAYPAKDGKFVLVIPTT